MKLNPIVCTNCGAHLKVEPGKTTVVCEYCGATFVIDEPIPSEKPISEQEPFSAETPGNRNVLKRAPFLLKLRISVGAVILLAALALVFLLSAMRGHSEVPGISGSSAEGAADDTSGTGSGEVSVGTAGSENSNMNQADIDGTSEGKSDAHEGDGSDSAESGSVEAGAEDIGTAEAGSGGDRLAGSDSDEDSSIGTDSAPQDSGDSDSSSTLFLDYGDAGAFEKALNAGENLEGKIVRFIADDYHTDTPFGCNIWAGNHLNFVSNEDPGVRAGDVVTVRTGVIEQYMGSWIIWYQMAEGAEEGAETVFSDPSETEDEEPAPGAKVEKNGFNENTAREFDFQGIRFLIPSYFYESDDADIHSFFAETGRSTTNLTFRYVQDQAAASETLFRDEGESLAYRIAGGLKADGTHTSVISEEEYQIAGKPAIRIRLTVDLDQDLNAEMDLVLIYLGPGELAGVTLIESDESRYGYDSDFEKILAAAVVS